MAAADADITPIVTGVVATRSGRTEVAATNVVVDPGVVVRTGVRPDPWRGFPQPARVS